MLTFVNGQLTDAQLLLNRGLCYGDGLFTTIAVRQATPQLWSYHWARLQHGANVLQFALPDEASCYDEVCMAVQQQSDAVVKIIWLRQDAVPPVRGYTPVVQHEPMRIISVHSCPTWPTNYWDTGICLAPLGYPCAEQSKLAGIKHLNRLDNVLAAAELTQQYPDAQEGWCCDQSGNIIGGVKSNVFIIKDDCCYTPPLQRAGVQGVLRAYLIDYLQSCHYPIVEATLTIEQLLKADAVFVTNALIGLWPVTHIATPTPHTVNIPSIIRQWQAKVASCSLSPMSMEAA